MNRVGLGVVLLALVLMTFMAGSAMAVGTSGDTGTIQNGIFNLGDTVPQGYGEMSIRYRKNATDSKYAFVTDGSTTSITVDTAYDLRAIYTPADTTAPPNDTALYLYWIENLGNAAITIALDTQKILGAPGDSDYGKMNYRILFDNGAAPGDSSLTNETGVSTILLAAGAFRQVFLAVVIPDTAIPGETTTVAIRVADRAPIAGSSVTGDGWQDGYPLLAGDDSRDTQTDTVVTTVKGPVLRMAKTVLELNGTRSRPGDTLIFSITFDNDGNDSAYGVQLIDAVPENTRYVPYSADSGNFLGNANAGNADTDISVGLDTRPAGSTWTFPASDSDQTVGGQYDTNPIRAIQWTLKSALGESNGDANSAAPTYNDGTYDNGRVEFRVTIR